MDFIGKQPGKITLTSNGINTIRGHVCKNPHSIAIRTEEKTLTYGQLWERATKLANSMLAHGIGKGNAVITYMPNNEQYIEIFIASQLIAAPLTFGNYRLKADEIAYQINDTQANVIFVNTELLPSLLEIKDKISHVHHIIVIGESKSEEMQNYEEFLNNGSTVELSIEVLPENLHLMFYTSGTTGKPKGAARTMYANYNMAVSTCIELGLNNNDMLLVVAPMYAAATCGYAYATLIAGGTLLIVPNFEPEGTLKLIDTFKPTFIFMVPIMYDWMLSLPDETLSKYDLSSIRLVVSCGAPMHTSIFEKMSSFFKTKQIYNMLGSSELGFMSRISADEWLNQGKANSIGKTVFDMELKIVSKDGKDVEPGNAGLLYSRSPQIFDGYWKNEEGTKEAFLSHEWATVGDIARMDKEGYFYLVDRDKDMIVSGGTNIYPAQVEQVIRRIEGIADVGVIGVPDKIWGEQVKAVVVLEKGCSITENDIIHYCRKHLAGFKIPKSVDFADAIPRSLIGKMLKKELRKKYWEGKDIFIS